MFPELFRDDVFRLETQRLWLRWPTARDEAAIERLASEPAVADMTVCIPHPYPKGAAASFIYAARVGNAQGTALSFVLTPLARPSEVIGAIGLREEEGEVRLGFWLGPPSWGRGLMSEAVEALSTTVLGMSEVETIVAVARADNGPARRVLEKSGFSAGDARTMRHPRSAQAIEGVHFLRSREGAARHRPGHLAAGR